MSGGPSPAAKTSERGEGGSSSLSGLRKQELWARGEDQSTAEPEEKRGSCEPGRRGARQPAGRSDCQHTGLVCGKSPRGCWLKENPAALPRPLPPALVTSLPPLGPPLLETIPD